MQLTPVQEGMLFHTLYAPGSGVYHEQRACVLEGDLDTAAYERGWESVIERHPVLRTAFHWEGLPKPLQAVHRRVEPSWHRGDWRGLSPATQRERLAAHLREDRSRGFELGRAPLLRLALFRLGEQSHQLVLSFHHILLDGWCLPFVFRDVSIAYEALQRRQAPRLQRPRPYREFLLWLQSRDTSGDEAFWRRELAGFHHPTPLPAPGPAAGRSAADADAAAEVRDVLPADRAAALQGFARTHQLTLNTMVQAAWALLLARWSGQRDVLFGTTVSGRPASLPGSEAMVGLFINTLPVRAAAPLAEPLLPWLRELQERQAEARDHEHTPLARIQAWSEIPPGRPLFETIVVFENQMSEALSHAAVQLRTRELHGVGRTNYPLTLVVAPGAPLVLHALYDRSRIDPAGAARTLGHLRTLLAAMAEDPRRCPEDLPLLTPEERQQLLFEWGESESFGSTTCLHRLFEAVAARRPEAVAVSCGEEALTYRELDARAERLASRLRALGVGPDVPAALCLERSPRLVAALLAVLKAGGAYIPIDPLYPADRISFLLEDSGAPVLITDEKTAVPETAARLLRIEDVEREESPGGGPAAGSGPSPGNLAYVIYTSGSTGRPKGVLVTHGNAVRLFAATAGRFGFGEGDAWTLLHSYAFDFSVWEIWGALLYGGRLVVVPHWTSRSPESFRGLLLRERVTVLNQTPSAFRQLARADEEVSGPEGADRLALRWVIFGGEALEPATLGPWLSRHGGHRPRLVNMYGITETTVHVTWREMSAADLDGRSSPVGRAIPDLRLRLLDARLEPVPIGAAGEIHVGGPGLARGYLGRPELTAERFVPDPFCGPGSTGARLYRTGDLARHRPDGELEYLGRADHQVKVRGHRIELGEVEAALARHPQVREAVVALREDRLVAYVVPRGAGAAGLTAGGLRSSLRAWLPEPMLPAAFVILDALPVTPHGKVDRRALPDLGSARQEAGASRVPPRGPVEEALAAIWAEVLDIEAVDAHDSFFDLGGHSLLATRAVARVRSVFGVDVPLRSLFEAPSVSGFAAVVETALRGGSSTPPPPVPMARDTPPPLSFAQQRLWFLHQLEPWSAAYNLTQALRIDGPLSAAGLARALAALVARHEALRTTFPESAGAPVQAIAPPPESWPLPVVDLAGLPTAVRTAEARRLAAEEARRPFDLAAGPLLRTALLHLAPEEHRLLLALHHVVTDGWSMGILVAELSALYRADLAGTPADLPPLPIQYADYAVWQRSWLSGATLAAEIAHWRERLAGAPVLALPTDRPRPAMPRRRGGRLPLSLGGGLAPGIRALARRDQATPFMVLLAAFQALLARWSGQSDVCVGTPIAGRRHRETEGMIGLFINTLVLRGDLGGDPTFPALVRRARAAALDAYAHQDVPFASLVEELAPQRSLAWSPLFQVMLVLDHEAPRVDLPGLRLTPEAVGFHTAKFDLTLELAPRQEGFGGALEYDADLFDAPTAGRLLGHFPALLEAACANLGRPLRDLVLLNEAERHQLSREWNDTGVGAERALLIHELFARQAAARPEAVALIWGGEQVRYGELARRVSRLARRLRRLGVGPETVAGVCLERRPELVVALLAVLEAGGAYLPLDPAYPRERLALMLEDSRAVAVISRPELETALPGSVPVCRVESDGDDEETAGGPERTVRVDPDHLAYLIYTSGSTGRPKAVGIRHGSAAILLAWAEEVFGPEELSRVLAATPVSFDLSVYELFLPLSRGGTVVLADNALALPGLDAAVTLVNTVPSAMAELLRLGLPRTVRTVNLAGEALPRWLVDELYRTGHVERVYNLYGPSEDTTYSTFARVAPGGRTVPIGRPVRATQVYVVEGHSLQPLGVPGELWIGGEGLARGYVGRPDLTAERFVADPFGAEPGARLYRTGDLVRSLPDGSLEYLGRQDHQVKVRGFRIELGEIEAALAENAAVEAAVVVSRADGGEPRLVAYVVPASSELDALELREQLGRRLPQHMVPAVFVELAALPLTRNGKIDRTALPAPEPAVPRPAGAALRTPVEELLAGIWEEVLRVERVRAEDDFFALGGHSLLATRVTSRVRDSFGVELPLQALFEQPTLAGLAARIAAALQAGERLELPPILPIPRDRELPLSFAQQRLWFLHQWEPHNPAYNVPTALRLQGDLEAPVLARVLTEVVRRHEVLRTSFAAGDGAPVQRIHPAAGIPLPLVDLAGLPEPVREPEAYRLARDEARLPFDLERAPFLRATLLRLGARDHLALSTMHHIASDGWSSGVLAREVGLLYQAFSAGRPSPLPELPIQYADHAAWQRRWLSGQVLDAQMDHWRQRLAGAPPVLDLPTDRSRPPVRSPRGAVRSAALGAGPSRALLALGRREGATLFMTVLAGFAALLGRVTGSEDLSLGTPVAGRTRVETEGLIGLFINTLVLRTDLTGDPTFRDLLGRARKRALDAHAHQDLPFEKLVEELAPERNLSHTPLFQVMFVLQNTPRPALELPGLTLSPVEAHSGAAKFDLTLSAVEGPDGIGCSLEYAADLFDEPTALRLLGSLLLLLEGAATDPYRRLSSLPLLSEAERAQLLWEWNDTRLEQPGDRCLHELLAEQAARHPNAPAVVCKGTELTYGELDARANALAWRLAAAGVGPEVSVAVAAERSPELLVGLLAVLKAGGAYVPIDASYPDERLAFLLADSGARLVLTQEKLLSRLSALAGASGAAPVLLEDAGGAERGPAPAVLPEHPAYVIYTSGSTGLPKGVVVPHRGLVHYLTWAVQAYRAAEGRGAPVHSPLGFDLTVTSLFAPLLAGRTVVLLREERGLAPLVEALRGPGGFSLLKLTPAHLAALAPELPALKLAGSTGVLILGGEALAGESLAPWRDRAPRTRLINEYGPTETVVGCAVHEVAPGSSLAGPVPIGRPIANTGIHLLDAACAPVPIGVTGEIYIGGLGLARGYLRRPALTAERFVPHPFATAPGERLYRSGDLARRRPDGTLEYLGRRDDQVKVRGFRIELGEIEAALASHPDVAAAAVAVRDEEGDRRLAAYLVPHPGRSLAGPELRAWLAGRLPEPMMPSSLTVLEDLPRTAHGKVDRARLPAPEPAAPRPAGAALRTPVEELLAGIWEEVLRVEKVRAEDDFFALGGHSLLATRVVSRVRDSFGVELPLQALFEQSTLAGLAARIEAVRHAGEGLELPPVIPIPRDRELLLSFAQQRLWFLHQLAPESAAYNLPFSFLLAGRLDVPALARALSEVVRRHEVLRTSFPGRGGRPVQEIAHPAPEPLPVIDLTALAPGVREAAATALADAEAARPFDLSRPPVTRARLLRLGEEEHALLFTIHHVSGDGWSVDVLTRELTELYAAFATGRTPRLPELPLQYADFAWWQRQWLQGEVLDEQIAFWRRQLAGAPPALDLPTDRPRPPVPSFRGGRERRSIPAAEAGALRALGRRAGSTPFMTLLAGLALLLHRYSSQDTVVVGTPIAGRRRAELEELIGLFANTLALRVDLVDGQGFRDLLARVRDTSLAAYAHQDLPFDKLVDELQPQRDMSRAPVFQVMLVLRYPPQQAQPLPGLTLGSFGSGNPASRFDLTLDCLDRGDQLLCALDYSADLFEPGTAARMLRLFGHLLGAAAAAPDTPMADLPLLDEEERQQVLWRRTGPHPAEESCLHQLFEEQAARRPEAVAVVSDAGSLTYGELARRAARLARTLADLGIGPESRVGVCLERSAEAIAALLGVLEAGGAYVPLDPDWPRERLETIAASAGLAALITHERFISAFTAPVTGPQTATPPVLAVEAAAGSGREIPPGPASALPDGAAYVIYTSGSTGAAKGVVATHRGAVNFVRGLSAAVKLGPDDRLLLFAPLSFDASVLQIFPVLACGGSLAIHPAPRELGSGEILAFCERHGVTVLDLPAALWRQWVEEVAERRSALPAGLRFFLTGGESVPTARLRTWAGRVAGSAGFLSSYGPTEATVTTALFRTRGGEAAALSWETVPIGQPLPGTWVHLLDRSRRPVPAGVPGEIYIGGAGLARCYLGSPGLTAEAFVPVPEGAAPGERLYRTGDLARWLPDGHLEFLGRADHQVKIRGFRVELEEIEAVLARHPAVREAVVTAPEEANGVRRLVAYFTAEEAAPPAPVELRTFLAAALPDFMIPSAFVLLDEMPLLASGKVDRRALPAPDHALLRRSSEHQPPRTAVERVLAGIWQQVLGVPEVGAFDDFFELGGHSLLATQVASRIRDELEVDLELRQIFEASTIATLAEALLADPARRDHVTRSAELTLELAELPDDQIEAMLTQAQGDLP